MSPLSLLLATSTEREAIQELGDSWFSTVAWKEKLERS
jgi:hypothetical protein